MTKIIRLSVIASFILCLHPFSHGIKAGLSGEGKALNPFQDYPDIVRAVSSKAKKVYKNENGFWEAEFEHGIIMVYIPPGEYQMGSGNNGNPLRSVHLDGYWIGKHEVTFDQYDQFCEEQGVVKPDDEGWGRARRPVINVSWLDAIAYCRWLSKKIGLNFKLPTESQWEKAARGTDGRMYPWGNSLPSGDKANFRDSNTKLTTPVGSYPEGSSPYGVLDMAGNVSEWCLDWHSSSYSSSSSNNNSGGPKRGTYRVLRGGSWYGVSRCLRTTFRTAAKPTSRYFHIGFRLSME